MTRTRIPADGLVPGSVVLPSDSRLTDARTPTAHTHGNVTNAGAIGSTANLPIITTTSGVLAAGSFGTAANTFCQGNDSRLSDARAPTSHTHGSITNAGAIGSTANLPIITTTSGVLATGTFGTAANTFAAGNHTHGNVTNAGAIGSTANLPVITTTSGVLTTGTFGTAANSFCQGNDSRLSDARTPTAHNQAASTISDSTTAGRALLTAADAPAQRTALGLGTMATQASTAYLATTGGTLTGQVAVTAGTASAPGIGFAGDTDTGVAQLGGTGTVGLVANGMECLRTNQFGNLAAVVEGGTTTLYPGYMCRAWINFQGSANSNITGTYSQSGTTVTITTSVAHNLVVGQRVILDFTSGTAADQGATVASVTSSTVFTATLAGSATTSGNVTLTRNTIRNGGNVSSVVDAGTGYYGVNMFIPAPHTNYAVLVSTTLNSGVSFSVSAYVEAFETGYFLIGTSTDNTRALFDSNLICVAVFY